LSGKQRNGPHGFPFGIFWVVLALVCLALGLSALYGYWTLSDLRVEYLGNRAKDVVAAAEQQTRGPGRYWNLEIWQAALDSSLERNSESVSSISLLDSEGRTLASTGPPEGKVSTADTVVFQVPLESGRGRGWGREPEDKPAERYIEIALHPANADFIIRQAYGQTFIAAIAIVALLGLGFYFTRTLKRFLMLKSREESERHLAALGAMSATLAHEIRNPLGAMKGLTQVVQEDLPKDHQSQDLMKTVVAEAERLEQLVTDLLAFARPAEPRLSKFDLTALLQEVTNFLRPQARESGATIAVAAEPKPTIVHSDRDGLRQVILNLILNALEASSANGRVEVMLSTDDGTREVRLEIRDHGPGLGDQDPSDLFLPFKTTKVKGSGLGLAISKRVVERLGGRIRLENASGGGTRCSLRIPLKSR